MSIQDDMHAAGQEYARRLEKQRETDRLAALTLEAQHHGNASAFAGAVESAFDNLTQQPPATETDDLADLAEAIRNDAPQENS